MKMCVSVICKNCETIIGDYYCLLGCFDTILYIICDECSSEIKFVFLKRLNTVQFDNLQEKIVVSLDENGNFIPINQPCDIISNDYIFVDIPTFTFYRTGLLSVNTFFHHVKNKSFRFD